MPGKGSGGRDKREKGSDWECIISIILGLVVDTCNIRILQSHDAFAKGKATTIYNITIYRTWGGLG